MIKDDRVFYNCFTGCYSHEKKARQFYSRFALNNDLTPSPLLSGEGINLKKGKYFPSTTWILAFARMTMQVLALFLGTRAVEDLLYGGLGSYLQVYLEG